MAERQLYLGAVMAKLFSTMALFFIGGTAIATFVSGDPWPVIIAVVAICLLVPVFRRLQEAEPPSDFDKEFESFTKSRRK